MKTALNLFLAAAGIMLLPESVSAKKHGMRTLEADPEMSMAGIAGGYSGSSSSGAVAAAYASKSGKAAKSGASDTCSKRKAVAFGEILANGHKIQKYFDDKGLNRSDIQSMDDVDALCEFNSHASANQGCWALYEKENGYVSSTDYFGDDDAGEAAKIVYESIDEYCECSKGYESGCIAEAPFLEPSELFFPSQVLSGPYNTPAQYLDYCVFAGVTNGDFAGASLSSSAEKCGCFWVDAVEMEIDSCPGVEIGEFD